MTLQNMYRTVLCLLAASALACSVGCSVCLPSTPDPWNQCADRRNDEGCAIVLNVLAGDVDLAEPAITCTGFEPEAGAGPCAGWPGVMDAAIIEGRYRRRFAPNYLFGYRWELEVEMASDTAGVARFCLTEFTDVPNDECVPTEWTCANSGTILLSEAPGPDNVRFVHGEIYVTFPDGQTVDARF